MLRKVADSVDGDENRHAAIKSENAFEFDANYLFSIQSELGVQQADEWLADQNDD